MVEINGKGVCGGVAFGPICFYRRGQADTSRHTVADAQAEVQRFEAAKGKAVAQLGALYEKALQEVGEEGAMLFQTHQLMLEDLDYCESITGMITDESVNAEYAVQQAADTFADMFAQMDDAYMQARAADVRDVSARVLGILTGSEGGGIHSDIPVIVAADDLAPSETVQLDKSKILGFITQGGSANSHTAILARTMGIPAVIGAGDALQEAYDGKQAVIDGSAGQAFIEPDAETSARLHKKQDEERGQKALLDQLKGQPNVTKDGQEVMLYANIGSPADLDAVLANDAGGIGLFRSEFLYLESSDYPDEETLFQAYRTVAEKMGGKRVIIRTLDIGADKQAAYFNLPHEENPAMGLRALRICLTRPEIFKTQLRALYRASAFGKVAIMLPMVTSVWEVQESKKLAEEVRAELRAEGVAFAEDVELGIMIETPAAAMISDRLAQEVDFFSVGTNDLTQYTLAVDRQNDTLGRFFDPHHPALLRLLKMTADNAHKHGIWMGICGELGADLDLTETFLSIGVDELSVSPSRILPLRKKVRETEVSGIREGILAGIMA
ncbi:phosphoenolpyruvate--protein phosphotransferase [Intestinibacillus massiliensis]|uniref:phosphoenolpyruvate--protein phosphotransferase n=1 Tax=Intestinibacillus massiliensis TaxID=1871029 RepID=UPI000B351E94|nr:phosphoenolpyruvate--protein phosphotransferase [Intestinibacillus massiliensis]